MTLCEIHGLQEGLLVNCCKLTEHLLLVNFFLLQVILRSLLNLFTWVVLKAHIIYSIKTGRLSVLFLIPVYLSWYMYIVSRLRHYAPVICNHCGTGEGWGIAGLKCWAIIFRVSSQCRGNDRALTIGFLPQGDFLLQRGKEQSFDLQFAPWGWGL